MNESRQTNKKLQQQKPTTFMAYKNQYQYNKRLHNENKKMNNGNSCGGKNAH